MANFDDSSNERLRIIDRHLQQLRNLPVPANNTQLSNAVRHHGRVTHELIMLLLYHDNPEAFTEHDAEIPRDPLEDI